MSENKEYLRNADEKGSVNISEEVIAQLAAAAMADVEGVGALATPVGRELRQRNAFKGARVSVEEDGIRVDAYITVKQGNPVTEVAKNVQNAVWEAVESTTGLSMKCVNVQVCGISFGK